MQATEIIKEILGVGESLAGSLLVMDALTGTFRKVRVKPDPACDLDCLRGEGRSAAPDVVLTNSFGFGGINAAVVLRRG